MLLFCFDFEGRVREDSLNMARRGKGSANSTSRPSGMGTVGEKCLPLERAAVPKEEPSFNESKNVKVIVRAVIDDEP